MFGFSARSETSRLTAKLQITSNSNIMNRMDINDIGKLGNAGFDSARYRRKAMASIDLRLTLPWKSGRKNQFAG
jgi:hypothetical protein